MTIALLGGALRYLGLTQPVTARILGVPRARFARWASGEVRPAPHAWPRLTDFARAREAELERLGACSREEAERRRTALDAPPPGFPSMDSYVTLLAEAVLRTAVEEARSAGHLSDKTGSEEQAPKPK